MNIIWIFDAGRTPAVAKLARGEDETPYLYLVDFRSAASVARGHVEYPKLPDDYLKRMLPLRAVKGDLDADFGPIDPLDLQIRGELADRIQTLLDRWGFAGRDQKLVGGFLSDSGFEVAGRYLDAMCLLSRLTKRDFDLQVNFEALLARQQREGEQSGAFVGGNGPLRPAASWTQGIVLGALISYYEHSGGDPRAIDAGERVVDWYGNLLDGKFAVGSWGGNGRYGALDPLLAFYARTRNPKALALARRMAAMDRVSGGVAWMISGKDCKDHLHSCLNTVRGLPWLYVATGDRSYLDDSIAACDRIFEWCTWSNGAVAKLVHPAEPHAFKTDETCPTADEVMLSYHLWDLTHQEKFYHRAEVIYYNGIRFLQWFNGNFNTYSDPYIGLKGPDNWWCCSWWGAKALHEVARHLYAASSREAFVNGFMPSGATLRFEDGSMDINMEADIPGSGDIRLTVTPRGLQNLALNRRIPDWSKFREVRINGAPSDIRPKEGYARIERAWRTGDRVELSLDLPLQVVLESGYGPTSVKRGPVSVDGAEPVSAGSILIYRGPAIVAHFRLQNGCDLVWAYSGDEPHLFETTKTTPDTLSIVQADYRHDVVPQLTRVITKSAGILIQWEWRTGPGAAWTLNRSAWVSSTVPVQIEYTAEIVPPHGVDAREIVGVMKSARLCGVRMQWPPSEPSTYFEKHGYPRRANVTVDHRTATPEGYDGWRGRRVILDSGSVQFHVSAASKTLVVNESSSGAHSGVYCVPKRRRDGRISASCRLEITGQSQFHLPLISPARPL